MRQITATVEALPMPPQTTNSTTPTAYGWCSWHEGYARGVRLIQVTEQGSGPSTAGHHFACYPCRHAYDLVPFADQP